MAHNSETGRLIHGSIRQNNLKRVFWEHIFLDKWDVINDLKSLKLHAKSPLFDRAVYHSIFGRSASLKYRYAKAKSAFSDSFNLLSELDRKAESTIALKAFLTRNYGVFLGYTGKGKESKKHLNKSKELHLKLNATEDLEWLKLYAIDLGVYFTLTGYTSVKNELRDLRTELNKSSLDFKGYNLRMGVLEYLIYRKNGNIRSLRNSQVFFRKELDLKNSKKSTKVFNYRAFWAQCGAVVTAHYLGEDYQHPLNETPPNAIKYASRFPPVILLIIQYEMIKGKDKRAWDKLRRFGKHIDKMLDEFPQDGNYQKFILENYSEVVKERIIEGFEANDWTNEQRMNRIIRANEILQNRLLKTTNTHEMNIAIILEGLARRKKNRGLVYVTAEYFRYGQRKAILMVRPDLKESDCYLEEIDVGSIQSIVSQFFQAEQGRKQKLLLSKLGSQLKILKKIVESNNLLIVPNSLFLKIPLHMIRINGKFLFETTRSSYWPSLRLVKYESEKSRGIIGKTCVIHTSAEKMAIQEADRIKKDFPDCTVLSDPNKEKIIYYTKGADIVHIIAHQLRGKIQFNKLEFETNEFLSLIRGPKSLVVMNVCGSGVRNTREPPIEHQSIAHVIMKNNKSTVISHNWDLSQTSSYSFSSSFYKSLVNKNSIIKSFAKSLGTLKNNSPVVYGGYMLWGRNISK